MVNRFIGSLRGAAMRTMTESASLATYVRHSGKGFAKTAHHTLMALGVFAIAALGTMLVKPDFADHFKSLSPFSVAAPQPAAQNVAVVEDSIVAPAKISPTKESRVDVSSGSAVDRVALVNEQSKMLDNQLEQKWVTNWLAKRYRVASDATNMLVSAAYLTAKDTKLDPLLILSVMAIESGFNPFAESAGGAQGLMQVMSKVHHDKFRHLGGVKAALNPVANIKVGSLILKDYVTRGGSVEAGLKMYVGAAAFQNDAGYGSKVLAEYHRLKDVANGKSVPVNTTTVAPKPRQPESIVDKPADPLEAGNTPQVSPDIAVTKANQIAVL